MQKKALLPLVVVVLAALGPGAVPHSPGKPGVVPSLQFGEVFRDTTMRLDYYHTGGPGPEAFAVDRVVSDGRWAGSRAVLLDTLNLGTYRFRVMDSATGEPLYSRGFSSLYAEWEIPDRRPPARSTSRSASPGPGGRSRWRSNGGTDVMRGFRPGRRWSIPMARSLTQRGGDYGGEVGAFAGAAYEATGLYRPQLDCIMFSRTTDFCRACGRAIARVIAQYATP